MQFFTAGESHGKGLTTLITDFPRGIKVDEKLIYSYLERRQKLGGRGGRSQKEEIKFEIISGVYKGATTGATICVYIPNKISSIDKIGPINAPRPGHIDLSCALKYLEKNSREFLERASARETAARTVAGAFAKMLLNEFNIEVLGYTEAIGDIWMPCIANGLHDDFQRLKQTVLRSPYALPTESFTEIIAKAIENVKNEGDTLGGVVGVIAKNVPPGLGNHDLWFKRLDAQLASALFSIQAVKGLEIGEAILSSQQPGSKVYGDITYNKNNPYLFKHTHDFMGGIEGGLSNSEDIKLRVYIKPVPTMIRRKKSINLHTLEESKAHYESSDFCIVPSASVICEASVCIVLASAFLDRFGAVDISQTKDNFYNYLKKLNQIYCKKN